MIYGKFQNDAIFHCRAMSRKCKASLHFLYWDNWAPPLLFQSFDYKNRWIGKFEMLSILNDAQTKIFNRISFGESFSLHGQIFGSEFPHHCATPCSLSNFSSGVVDCKIVACGEGHSKSSSKPLGAGSKFLHFGYIGTYIGRFFGAEGEEKFS